jgi:hypothetical protein
MLGHTLRGLLQQSRSRGACRRICGLVKESVSEGSEQVYEMPRARESEELTRGSLSAVQSISDIV